jgi:hypothetical protein
VATTTAERASSMDQFQGAANAAFPLDAGMPRSKEKK